MLPAAQMLMNPPEQTRSVSRADPSRVGAWNPKKSRATFTFTGSIQKRYTVPRHLHMKTYPPWYDLPCPGRVVDILEACGAFDPGSNPGRGVLFYDFALHMVFKTEEMSILPWKGIFIYTVELSVFIR